jgi:hypothetical protein
VGEDDRELAGSERAGGNPRYVPASLVSSSPTDHDDDDGNVVV